MFIGFLECHVAPHLALRSRTIGIEWPCTRKENYVSQARRWYIVCDRRSDLRQFYPQFTQPRLRRNCGSLLRRSSGVRYQRRCCKASDEYGATIDVNHGFLLLLKPRRTMCGLPTQFVADGLVRAAVFDRHVLTLHVGRFIRILAARTHESRRPIGCRAAEKKNAALYLVTAEPRDKPRGFSHFEGQRAQLLAWGRDPGGPMQTEVRDHIQCQAGSLQQLLRQRSRRPCGARSQ